jgi:hypothetical protein
MTRSENGPKFVRRVARTIFDLQTPYKRQTFVPDLLPIVFKTSVQGLLIGQLLVKYVKHDTRMAMVTTALILYEV